MALSQEQVWAVADEIESQGGTPTIAAVRKALGYGSFTTISEAMRQWHRMRKGKSGNAAAIPLELDDAVRRFALEVWSKAVEIAALEASKAAREYSELQKDWERERQELEAVADDLASALEDCHRKAQEDAATLSNLQAVATELEARIRVLEATLSELREENRRLHETVRFLAGKSQIPAEQRGE
jgi:uncharacterized protein YukE